MSPNTFHPAGETNQSHTGHRAHNVSLHSFGPCVSEPGEGKRKQLYFLRVLGCRYSASPLLFLPRDNFPAVSRRFSRRRTGWPASPPLFSAGRAPRPATPRPANGWRPQRGGAASSALRPPHSIGRWTLGAGSFWPAAAVQKREAGCPRLPGGPVG